MIFVSLKLATLLILAILSNVNSNPIDSEILDHKKSIQLEKGSQATGVYLSLRSKKFSSKTTSPITTTEANHDLHSNEHEHVTTNKILSDHVPRTINQDHTTPKAEVGSKSSTSSHSNHDITSVKTNSNNGNYDNNHDNTELQSSNNPHIIKTTSKPDQSQDNHITSHGSDSHKPNSHNTNENNHNKDPHGGNSHNDNNNHGEGSDGHHVPPPSFQLQPHMYSYKPEGFSMFSREIGIKKILVGFNYHTISHYDRYIIRIRFHGHEEYSTHKLKVNKTEPNQIILNKFLEAQYIICVTLFSSSGLPEYPPLSTSDMCLDVSAGEPVPIGGHHSTTGLLSPLLVAVAAVLLILIVIGQNIKDVYIQRVKKFKENNGSKASLDDDDNNYKGKDMRKSETQIEFDRLIKAPEDPKWQAAVQMTQIVDNRSFDNLTEPSNYFYDNKTFTNDNNENSRRPRTSRIYSQNLTSLDTLNHLLEDKPWLRRYYN